MVYKYGGATYFFSGRKIAKKGHFAPTPCKQLFFLKNVENFAENLQLKPCSKILTGKLLKLNFNKIAILKHELCFFILDLYSNLFSSKSVLKRLK